MESIKIVLLFLLFGINNKIFCCYRTQNIIDINCFALLITAKQIFLAGRCILLCISSSCKVLLYCLQQFKDFRHCSWGGPYLLLEGILNFENLDSIAVLNILTLRFPAQSLAWKVIGLPLHWLFQNVGVTVYHWKNLESPTFCGLLIFNSCFSIVT